jgi:hypothetical protein
MLLVNYWLYQRGVCCSGDYLSSELQHVACRVYYDMLCELPAVTRHWWNGLSKKSATIVNEFTTRFVSPVLCANELHRIQAPAVSVENLAVRELCAMHGIVIDI